MRRLAPSHRRLAPTHLPLLLSFALRPIIPPLRPAPSTQNVAARRPSSSPPHVYRIRHKPRYPVLRRTREPPLSTPTRPVSSPTAAPATPATSATPATPSPRPCRLLLSPSADNLLRQRLRPLKLCLKRRIPPRSAPRTQPLAPHRPRTACRLRRPRLYAGLPAGLSAGLPAELSADLFAGLSAGLSAGLPARLPAGPAAGSAASPAASPVAGPAAGSAAGLTAGPATVPDAVTDAGSAAGPAAYPAAGPALRPLPIPRPVVLRASSACLRRQVLPLRRVLRSL